MRVLGSKQASVEELPDLSMAVIRNNLGVPMAYSVLDAGTALHPTPPKQRVGSH